ncbi:hypothetical protein M8818_005992 [Zalaria obscura]|uniref:Uncharacterized protein n=1 Tax=Zalaria obscura TaxID=2024903 RepID=A0ACC3S7I9_9PEZI
MPAADADMSGSSDAEQPLTRLPFPPFYKSHVLHCSYHWWHPRYRTITPKARLVPLTPPFLDYLRADGIVLPDDEDERRDWSDSDSGIFSSTENPDAADEDEDEDEDPAAEWREVHTAIKATIAELGGKVVPKLNWSAPKDATWISATNSMDCRTPSDIYLLLKSSDFVTHDLEHAFDDCEDDPTTSEEEQMAIADIPYHLALRKFVQLNPSVEFRCFVRNRKLIAITQRDLNHFDFLFNLQDKLRDRIQDFFDDKLKSTFPDESFVFDVYIPPPHNRVWLIDFNPWAQRTDPLLFSWLELLTMPEPPEAPKEEVVSIPIRYSTNGTAPSAAEIEQQIAALDLSEDGESDEEADEELWVPEFRLVKKDDPEAYSFNTPQFSAHKLPKDVVDASQAGAGGLREFAENWKDILEKRQKQDAEDSSEDE